MEARFQVGFNASDNVACQFELYPEQDMGLVIFTNGDTGWLLVDALREYLVIGQDL
ncbi:MAG: hypothetical protein AB8G16_19460 [Gammaproteobacteria bacterium]